MATALDRARLDDIAKAIHPDGSPVDIHRATAAKMFGIAYECVTDQQRRHAKAVLYHGIYTPNSGVQNGQT